MSAQRNFVKLAHKALANMAKISGFPTDVKQLDSAKGLARTFVKTPNGLKVVNPEGYVAIDKSGGAVKIVDKLEFSFNNFTVAKNWDK